MVPAFFEHMRRGATGAHGPCAPDGTMDTEHRDTREILEEAADFARNGDFTAAVSRAKDGLRVAADPASEGEARLAVVRFEALLHAWNAENEARGSAAARFDAEGAPISGIHG